jgi:hypothetical protein
MYNWGIPVREIRIGSWEAQRGWLNQFLLRVNAEERCMEFDMFKFSKDS